MQQNRRFLNCADHIAAPDIRPVFNCRFEMPFLCSIKAGNLTAAKNIAALFFIEFVERPLNTVINAFDKAWAKFNAQWFAGIDDRFAGANAYCIFINLNARGLTFQLDDFADKVMFADSHNIVHS